MTTLPVLHIAQGDTAAGLLLQGVRSFGLPGGVHRLREDLSHGPLGDGRARMTYMKACCRCLDQDFDPDPGVDDTDRQWQVLRERVGSDRPGAVAVWHSGSAADYVFLRMAAAWLKGAGAPLCMVEVPPRGSDHGVAIYNTAQLAPMFGDRRMMLDAEVEALSRAFAAIRDRPEPLRRYDGVQLEFLPIEGYDEHVLKAVGNGWSPAVRVIADVWQGWRDGRNWLTDVFIAARLSALIEAGRLEAEGDRSRIQAYRVRRSADAR
jgi:hypothetical protein